MLCLITIMHEVILMAIDQHCVRWQRFEYNLIIFLPSQYANKLIYLVFSLALTFSVLGSVSKKLTMLMFDI